MQDLFRPKRMLDVAAIDLSGRKLEDIAEVWLDFKTKGHRVGGVTRTSASFNSTVGDGGRDFEYRAGDNTTVRVDVKVADSNVGVHRVASFKGRFDAVSGNVTGVLVAYPKDFTKEAKQYVVDQHAINFVGSNSVRREIVLVSGDSLLEQISEMHRSDRKFEEELRRLELEWQRTPAPSAATARAAVDPSATSQSDAGSDTASDTASFAATNSEDDEDLEADPPSKRLRSATEPTPPASPGDDAGLVEPVRGLRVWLNLCDQPEDRRPECGTYEGTVVRVESGRRANNTRVSVQIEKKVCCSRLPAAAVAVDGPEQPKCADQDGIVQLDSFSVHELWTVDGLRRVDHPYSKRLKILALHPWSAD